MRKHSKKNFKFKEKYLLSSFNLEHKKIIQAQVCADFFNLFFTWIK